MGYYADAERHYDPEAGSISRWKKRDKMTADDLAKVIENFIEQAENGGKEYKWVQGDVGAPLALRLSHPGTPSYEDARMSLAEEPGYGEESALKVALNPFSYRYYLVDLTDVDKLYKQIQAAAEAVYDLLVRWDDSQAAAEEDDTFEDNEPEDFFDRADREYDEAKDEGAFD